MSKFKVGDRARRVGVSSRGVQTGQVYVVSDVVLNSWIRLAGLGDGDYHTDNFELVEQFGKDALRDGDFLEFEDGSTGFWLGGCSTRKTDNPNPNLAPYYQIWSEACYYSDDLKDPEGLDIDKVVREGNTIFERESEKIELTMQEIADKFNVPVEQVMIKKGD